MPETKKPVMEILPEDRVRLPSIMGIRPGVYLAFIYGLIILAIIFFVTVNPGLKNPGTVLSIKTEPAGAAIRINGVYQDSAPCEIFVPKGKQSIEIVLPGFSGWKNEIDFGGSVFFSMFFPLRSSLEVELKAVNPIEAFKNEANEFAAWSFFTGATMSNQVPLVLSEGAYRLGKEAADKQIMTGMKETLSAAARFTVSRTSMRDLIRAKFLLDNKGISPSPLSITESLNDIIAFLDKNPETAQWLADILPAEAAFDVRSSSWYSKNMANVSGNRRFNISRGREQNISGLRFREIVVLNEVSGENSSFFIAETPVPLDLWESFINENPRWNVNNRDFLIERELVNSQYMAYAYFPSMPANIAAWVSWHAASAWCEWFNSKLPANSLTHVRLPLESEWEFAAQTGLSRAGEFWEWCEDPYAPLRFHPSQPAFDPGSPERPVRGGSWINPRNTITINTRGSLPPDSCSPFVSFRPVIAAK